MKLSTETHDIISRLNSLLIQNKHELIGACLEGVDLEELLSQKTLDVIRATNKVPLVLFLATLAVNNEISPHRAQLWLDCYQSIVNKKLTENILKLSHKNILYCILKRLISKKSAFAEDIENCKGSTQQWHDAFELTIDFNDWPTAVAFAQQLKSNKHNLFQWRNIIKILASRHDLYVDATGKKKFEVDYLALSNIYEICAQQAALEKDSESIKNINYIRSTVLEVAGEHKKSISQLNILAKNNRTTQLSIDLARNLCKNGDLPSSINELDFAINRIGTNLERTTNEAPQNHLFEHKNQKIKSFSVSKASQALSDFSKVCAKKNIRTFLVSGTLLGYAREGQLLAHDKDIDIGIVGWKDQYDICMALQETGLFTIPVRDLIGHESYYIPIRHNHTGLGIDLFIYHPINDKFVTGVDFYFGYRQTFAFTPFDLKEINFLNTYMYAPSDIDLNLRENFGNWRIPDRNYLSHLESPSVVAKGGLEHMLTGRIQALGSILKKDATKLGKVIQVLKQHLDSPWAIDIETLRGIERICKKFELENSIKEPSHADAQEFTDA